MLDYTRTLWEYECAYVSLHLWISGCADSMHLLQHAIGTFSYANEGHINCHNSNPPALKLSNVLVNPRGYMTMLYSQTIRETVPGWVSSSTGWFFPANASKSWRFVFSSVRHLVRRLAQYEWLDNPHITDEQNLIQKSFTPTLVWFSYTIGFWIRATPMHLMRSIKDHSLEITAIA
jgi:hypothetical protein